jgi:Putative zinc-finger
MSGTECAVVRELLPDFATNRLAAEDVDRVDVHVSACADCRLERDLARSLFEARPAPPSGLADRIIEDLHRDRSNRARPRVHRPWWGVSAAAVAALMLGIGISSDRAVVEGPDEPVLDVPEYAIELEEGGLWISDDGMLAGAPSLDGLSDEALLELLDELTVGSSGGAV